MVCHVDCEWRSCRSILVLYREQDDTHCPSLCQWTIHSTDLQSRFPSPTKLLNHLLTLLQNLLKDLLDDLALIAILLDDECGLLWGDVWQTKIASLVEQLLLGAFAPSKPFVELSPTTLDDSLVAEIGKGGFVDLNVATACSVQICQFFTVYRTQILKQFS